jgi:hypothetical protein
METPTGPLPPSGGAERELDRELALVTEAVTLVASGAAPTVVLAGLHLTRVLLPAAERLAATEGVRVVPLWTVDEQQFDLRVERADP